MITLWIKFCHSRLRHRDNIWETERILAWHARRNSKVNDQAHRSAPEAGVERKEKHE